MSYVRVIPRDLFNEAKLLKCLGQLALLAHEGKLPGCVVDLDDPERPFAIHQDPNDGSLFSSNVEVRIRPAVDRDPVVVYVWTPLNSKDAYPLMFCDEVGDPCRVFDEDGSPSDDFLALLGVYQTEKVIEPSDDPDRYEGEDN